MEILQPFQVLEDGLVNDFLSQSGGSSWVTSAKRLANKFETFDGLVKRALAARLTQIEYQAMRLVDLCRPDSLREYDQIPMHSIDLLRQVRLIAHFLQGKAVAFMGDHDCTSVMLGFLGSHGIVPTPDHIMVLDFDERLLVRIKAIAEAYGFDHVMDYSLYNVFDALSQDMVAQFDWFYTNPPYGRYNAGESARLFITRGIELTKRDVACGCIILPDDSTRPWTREAMWATQDYLCRQRWTIDFKLNQMHQYWLDDDQHLSSSVMIVKSAHKSTQNRPLHYKSSDVDPSQIEHFYGRSIKPPYPRYIRQDGNLDYNWQ